MAALLDTSVIIDLDREDVVTRLPRETSISAITLAELAAGLPLATNRLEQARRQFRLQQVESLYEPLPFDAAAARAYGQIVAAVADRGRSHRSRVADLMIASVAVANRLDLYTRNPNDFEGMNRLLNVVAV